MSGLTAFYEGIDSRNEQFIITDELPTFVFAGMGNDFIDGSIKADLLVGGPGDDIIYGKGGDDTIYGDSSGDPLQTGGNDHILGGSGRDTIFGGAGNDFINGESGNDWIDGGPGDDVIWGGAGSDVLYGGDGNDVIFAYSDSKAPASLLAIATTHNGLNGSALANNFTALVGEMNAGGDFAGCRLFGDDGNDTLVGSNGIDIFTGGKGKDHFVFNVAPTTNVDVIKDFSPKDDTIDLLGSKFKGLGLTGLGPKGVLAKNKFQLGKKADDKSDRIIYDKDSGKLFWDMDGKGGSPQILFAKLDKGLKMTHEDFLVI